VSVLTQERRVDFAGSEVSTPQLRRTGRRALFWIVLVVLLLIFVGITFALTGTSEDKDRLSATNAHGNGAEALINVLRNDGVEVTTPHTIGAAERDASAHGPTTTLVIYDQRSILLRSQFADLDRVAGNIILIEPDSAALSAFTPGILQAGALASSIQSANCEVGAAKNAGRVSGLAHGYRIGTTAVDATGCFGTKGVYGLVRSRPARNGGGPTVTILGATTTLTNGAIQAQGNAALALGLVGATSHVVWYLPSFADADVQQDGVIPNPPWVLLATILAGIVLVSAGVWRGRRFGPVVVERMPVFVRSSETMEGRARLYQRSSSRIHALDALRIGSLGRMSTRCGLPSTAALDDVIAAIVRNTGRSAQSVKALLVDTLPATDAELIRLSDALAILEAEVATATQ
jgi:hypothetical protein